MNLAVRHFGVIFRSGLRDSVRRRLFLVLGVLSLVYVVLYAIGLSFVWNQISQQAGGFNSDQIDKSIVISATFAGLALFGIHFLGAVAGTFLVLGAVRGDAELGVLQPVLVRPVGRTTYLLARFTSAAVINAVYVGLMSLACFIVTQVVTGWWPDAPWDAITRMMLASVGLVAVALLGSVLVGTAANGIATFMVFGLALLGGLLDQLGESISQSSVRDVGQWVLRVLPFEAAYQWALDALTQDTVGISRLVITLGPFGGARSHSVGLVLEIALFCAVLVGAGALRLRRLDL